MHPRHQSTRINRGGRLAEQRDIVRITADLSDVFLHPDERGKWVQQPVVARTAARDSAAKSYGNFFKTSAYSTAS
jgi:hypothetical protein